MKQLNNLFMMSSSKASLIVQHDSCHLLYQSTNYIAKEVDSTIMTYGIHRPQRRIAMYILRYISVLVLLHFVDFCNGFIMSR